MALGSDRRICEAAKTNGLLEQELAHAVNASSHAINKTHPKFPEVCHQVCEKMTPLVNTVSVINRNEFMVYIKGFRSS